MIGCAVGYALPDEFSSLGATRSGESWAGLFTLLSPA